MNQEDKELLLKDLCVRLPYKTYVKTTKGIGYVYAINTSQLIELSVANDSEYWSDVFNIGTVKPYLRPMSSMTEEELYEVQEILGKGVEIHDVFISIVDSSINTFSYLELQAIFEWLLKNHFDFMGLIPKGLAIAVTEENNPYEN